MLKMEPLVDGLFCDGCSETYDAPSFVYCDVSCALAYCKPNIIDFDAKCVAGACVLLEESCSTCGYHITVEIEYAVDDVENKVVINQS